MSVGTREMLVGLFATDEGDEAMVNKMVDAIEADARADLAAENERLRAKIEDISVRANVHLAEGCPNAEARADLAARIEAWDGESVSDDEFRNAVLDIVSEEASKP